MTSRPIDRRRFLAGTAGLMGAAVLGGCDVIPRTSAGQRALQAGEDATLFVQRLLLSERALAPEYPEADISKFFKPNGTNDPPDRTYKALAQANFADYQLQIDGLVDRPLQLSLVELRQMPSRTQITRHDCVEGWSCIGKWKGVQVQQLLQRSGLSAKARYVVLHCADTMEGGEIINGSEGDQPGQPPIRYYESLDLTDAYHPQTILAYEMNGKQLPITHGAPLRLRVERQLGYKMAKYVMRLEVVDRLAGIGEGRGGYWEDRGYDWYAGI